MRVEKSQIHLVILEGLNLRFVLIRLMSFELGIFAIQICMSCGRKEPSPVIASNDFNLLTFILPIMYATVHV